MVYWNERTIDSLSHEALTQVTQGAISELIDLREEARKRRELDNMVLCFFLGVAFIIAAIGFGLFI